MTTEILVANLPLIVGVIVALIIFIILIVLLKRRRQHVELGNVDPVIAPTLARVAAPDPVLPPIVITPLALAPSGEADDLRRIKGLGPKVAARLNESGITRFDQLASLDAEGQAALDAQLGSFAGRMARDRWIEQAKLLARDDTAGFEAQFGKLG